MDRREVRPARGPRGKAVSRFEAAVVAEEANHWWFVLRLHEAGWPHQAIATHFDLSPERVGKIVAAAFHDAPYLARGREGPD